MTKYDLASELGLEVIPGKVFGNASSLFYSSCIANYRNDIDLKWSNIIENSRLEKMKHLKGLQVLAENGRTVLYRFSGKLFVNKLFGEGWRGKRIK